MFNNMYATFDFSSQYPSLMQEHNLCLSSTTTREYIATNDSREGIDYEIIEISSIQESAETGPVAPRPNKPQTFKNVRRAHKITKQVPFVSERYFMELSNVISTDMKALRRMYKTARAQAERDEDSDTEAPCDTQ